MNALAGRLEIEMAMNLARLQSDVRQASNIVGGMARDVERYAATAKSALEALGIALGAGAMVAFTRHTIDAIARMKELGDQAGVSAEAISRFDAPARMAGSSLEAVSTAMFRMSKAALEARDPSSKAAQALNSIGVSAAQLKNLKPDEMFELVARSLAKYSDGIQKNAVMQELFNKSGAEMNRVVKEIAERGALAATVTNEEAEAANRFNNQLVELKMNGESLWRSLASNALPILNDVVKAFMDAKKEGGFLNGVFAAIDTALGSIKADRLSRELEQVNSQIASARKAKEDLEREGTTKFGIERTGEIAQAAKLNEYLLQREQIERAIYNQEQAAQDRRAVDVAKANQEARARAARGGPNFDPNEAARVALFQQENAELDKQIAKLRGVGEVEAYIKKLEEDKYSKLTPAQKQELIDKERLLVHLQHENDERQAILKSVSDLIAAQQRLAALDQDYITYLRQLGQDEQFNLSIMGKTVDEQAKLRALRQLDLDLARRIAQVEQEGGDGLSQQQAEMIMRWQQMNEAAKVALSASMDRQAALRVEISLWQSVADTAMNFFTDLFEHGKSVFNNLWATIKHFFAQLAAMLATKWVLQIGASTIGGAAGSALAGQAAGLGSGSALGSIASTVGAGISDFSSGLAGTYAGSELGGSVLGELGSTFSTALMAIPVWGQILAAVIAVGAILASMHKGGPKTEGQFVTGGAAGFNIVGTSASDQAQKFAESIQAGFQAALKAFGGTSGAFQFGAGIVRDPQGTSPTFLDTLLRSSSGQEILRQHNANVGRSDEDLQAEMTLQTQRVILAALQNSTLPPLVSGILNSITAATASADEINAAMTAAQNAQAMWTQFQNMFSTDADKLAAAQDTVTKGFASLGVAVPKSSADFKKLVEGLDLSTKSGRDMFAALMELAPAFKTVEEASTAAASAMQENWDAVQTAIDTLTGRNRGPGELAGLVSQFQAGHSQFAGLSVDDFVKILTTITQADFAQYSAADQALIRSILALAATLTTSSTTISTAVQGLYTPPATSAKTLQDQFNEKYGGVIGAQPDQSSKLSLQIQLMQQQIAAWQAQQVGLYQWGEQYQELQNAIQSFQSAIGSAGGTFGGSGSGLTGQLAQLTILVAQYGEQKAEQLLALQQWYDAQRQLVAGNVTALDALKVIFDQKWKDIVDGIAGSSALDDAKSRLADWWKGLFLNQTLSPLTLQQRFTDAQKQYQATLALAQGGDVNAIGNLSGAAQTLLELARQLFASSPEYTALFRQIATDTGGVAGLSQADINSRLYSSLPTSGTLATNETLQSLVGAVNDLTTLIASGEVSIQAPAVQGAIESVQTELQATTSTGLFA